MQLGALYILESKYLVKIVDVSCEPDIPDEESHQSSKLHAKHFYVSRLNCVPKTYPFAHKKIPTKPINTGFVGIYLFIQTLPKGSIIKSKMLILRGIPPHPFHLMLLFSYRFQKL